mmetsp:Transcript_25650/g.19404  ORF Transcript_25650/g.19404 Transcript_25650/m.19404 type:complete len:116 (+) Transcript_25650:1228-1575(+)
MRISISWAKILPNGTTDFVNEEGVRFYHSVIDELQSKGIEVFVTLYHFDLPQKLQDQGGWISDMVSFWFEDYADFCFQEFGQKVKKWVTINEPTVFATLGNGYGVHAPGRCSEYM